MNTWCGLGEVQLGLQSEGCDNQSTSATFCFPVFCCVVLFLHSEFSEVRYSVMRYGSDHTDVVTAVLSQPPVCFFASRV